MQHDLWKFNSPAHFWQCTIEIPPGVWELSIRKALPLLQLDIDDTDEIPFAVLGEGQFGSNHWDLSKSKRLYYSLKPIIPRPISRLLRSMISSRQRSAFQLGWPTEDRYAKFLWEVARQALALLDRESIPFRSLWPDGLRFSLVLTHDVETARGLAFVRQIADMEYELGFRSSFNFVAERYVIDHGLLHELTQRGFETGVHGLRHDGKLFASREIFHRRADDINRYLAQFQSSGFRAPLTHRHPEWMQALDIEYDLSFFDTDPFEPIPGGTMSLWPFFIGRFVELPYTLLQDYTLTEVLGETSPTLWLRKVDFIRGYHGMALLNTHPDYLRNATTLRLYRELLETLARVGDYWQPLPRDAARWWRHRSSGNPDESTAIHQGNLVLDGDRIRIER